MYQFSVDRESFDRKQLVARLKQLNKELKQATSGNAHDVQPQTLLLLQARLDTALDALGKEMFYVCKLSAGVILLDPWYGTCSFVVCSDYL